MSKKHWALYSVDAQTAITTIRHLNWDNPSQTTQGDPRIAAEIPGTPAYYHDYDDRKELQSEIKDAKETQYPWNAKNLLVALYMGTYRDTEPGTALEACSEVLGHMNTATLLEGAEKGDCLDEVMVHGCCLEGRCSSWVMSVLGLMNDNGVLVLPTSTSEFCLSARSAVPHPFVFFCIC